MSVCEPGQSSIAWLDSTGLCLGGPVSESLFGCKGEAAFGNPVGALAEGLSWEESLGLSAAKPPL